MEVNNNGDCHGSFLPILTDCWGHCYSSGLASLFLSSVSICFMVQHTLSKDLSFLLCDLHSYFLSLSSILLFISGGRTLFLVFPGLPNGQASGWSHLSLSCFYSPSHVRCPSQDRTLPSAPGLQIHCPRLETHGLPTAQWPLGTTFSSLPDSYFWPTITAWLSSSYHLYSTMAPVTCRNLSHYHLRTMPRPPTFLLTSHPLFLLIPQATVPHWLS